MSTPTVFPAPEIQKARQEALDETIRSTSLFSKRTATPADKTAFAELTYELEGIKKRWAKDGLIAAV